MKLRSFILPAAALSACTVLLSAQEIPTLAQPGKEHEWLKKFEGEWESTSRLFLEPGKPPVEGKGSESVRMLGGFWIVSDGKGEMMGSAMRYSLTLGYDPARKAYVGTMIDSMTSTLWTYTGSVNEAGTVLTLETEGPCPMQGGKISSFRDIVEFKNDDHRTFTSMMLGENGEWITLVEGEARRK